MGQNWKAEPLPKNIKFVLIRKHLPSSNFGINISTSRPLFSNQAELLAHLFQGHLPLHKTWLIANGASCTCLLMFGRHFSTVCYHSSTFSTFLASTSSQISIFGKCGCLGLLVRNRICYSPPIVHRMGED